MNSNDYSLIVSTMSATVCTSSKITPHIKRGSSLWRASCLQKQLQRFHLHNILVATVKVLSIPSNVHGFHIHTLLWVTANSFLFLYFYYLCFLLNSKAQNSLCSHIVNTVQSHAKNHVTCTVLWTCSHRIVHLRSYAIIIGVSQTDFAIRKTLRKGDTHSHTSLLTHTITDYGTDFWRSLKGDSCLLYTSDAADDHNSV